VEVTTSARALMIFARLLRRSGTMSMTAKEMSSRLSLGGSTYIAGHFPQCACRKFDCSGLKFPASTRMRTELMQSVQAMRIHHHAAPQFGDPASLLAPLATTEEVKLT
ncbi:hypothetical protein DUNSADRAFT_15112, partial [Dunaliella salina]